MVVAAGGVEAAQGVALEPDPHVVRGQCGARREPDRAEDEVVRTTGEGEGQGGSDLSGVGGVRCVQTR
ncbi:hypothetical protein GCM10025870_16600 [Agromyces marinus]|uniref:Uncharacterized protein n=1 Tax=Agromyces marinus TaxID=1389020 RepID=A0ABN6YFA3_9MICO|nr:hypothetical protein GCM10025870_16600 [Agromyces marinus]